MKMRKRVPSRKYCEIDEEDCSNKKSQRPKRVNLNTKVKKSILWFKFQNAKKWKEISGNKFEKLLWNHLKSDKIKLQLSHVTKWIENYKWIQKKTSAPPGPTGVKLLKSEKRRWTEEVEKSKKSNRSTRTRRSIPSESESEMVTIPSCASTDTEVSGSDEDTDNVFNSSEEIEMESSPVQAKPETIAEEVEPVFAEEDEEQNTSEDIKTDTTEELEEYEVKVNVTNIAGSTSTETLFSPARQISDDDSLSTVPIQRNSRIKVELSESEDTVLFTGNSINSESRGLNGDRSNSNPVIAPQIRTRDLMGLKPIAIRMSQKYVDPILHNLDYQELMEKLTDLLKLGETFDKIQQEFIDLALPDKKDSLDRVNAIVRRIHREQKYVTKELERREFEKRKS